MKAYLFAFFCLFTAFSSLGCISATFQPLTATIPRATVERATQFYPNDRNTIRECNPTVLGYVNTAATLFPAFSDLSDLSDKAAVIAAANGATHFMLLRTGSYQTSFTTAGSAYAVGRSVIINAPQTYIAQHLTAQFGTVWVSPNCDLPPALKAVYPK